MDDRPPQYGEGNYPVEAPGTGTQPAAGSQAPPPSNYREPGYGYGYGIEEDEFHLRRYFDVLLRRRWTVLAVFATTVVATAILTLAATPMFKSSAVLQIQPSGPNLLSFEDVQDSVRQAQAYLDFFQTQYKILESRALAERTIEKLRLHENAEFNPKLREPGVLGSFKQWVGDLIGSDEVEDPEMAALRERKMLIGSFLDEVEISPQRKSFLVEVGFSSPNPRLARDVAKTMAEEYIGLSLDQTIDSAVQGRVFIEKQLSRTKAKLEQSEVALQEYAKGQEIHAIEQAERIIHDRLADLNSRLTEAEGERIRLESMVEQAKGPRRYTLPIVMQNPLLDQMKEELTRLEVQYAELRQTFSEAYPDVKRLSAQILLLENRIRKEEDALITSIEADHAAALEQEKLLRSQLQEQQQVVAAYEEKAIDFKIMKREVDTNRGIYESLLKRLREVEVAEAVRASNVTVVDTAEVPLRPDRPRLPFNLALALVIGSFGGVGVAFAQEYLDDTVKNPEDVEKAARLPTLAAVPVFRTAEIEQEPDGPSSFDQEVALQPTSPGAEAIRTLRASLFLAAAGGLPKRLLVTSPRPGEGKTCMITNLSISLAQMGRRVVVMDCDLRKPRLHKATGVTQEPGVSSYLTGGATLDEIVVNSRHPGLDVLPAGPVPPNPVDLFDSKALLTLMEELEERYDHVLIDAPPTLGFADVPVLANRLGGGCLLVAHAGKTSSRVLRDACEYLLRMQSRVLGIVLNKVAVRTAGYSYYGYGYGNYGYYGQYGDGPQQASRSLGNDSSA